MTRRETKKQRAERERRNQKSRESQEAFVRWFRGLPSSVQAAAWIVVVVFLVYVYTDNDDEPTQDSTPAVEQAEDPSSDDATAGDLDSDTDDTRTSAESRGSQRADDRDGRRTAVVTRIIDGDTVEMEGVGRVRLIGVDTPERGEECFEEATDYLKDRVGGRTVRYRYQSGREDRYDRQLLDLFRGGQLVNLDIAQAGWGEELTIQPNDHYATRIAAAEQDARAVPRGRWAGCFEKPQPEPSPPADEEDNDSGGSGGGGSGGEVPSGTCSEIGITDFPVPPGDPRDRDGDGIACET